MTGASPLFSADLDVTSGGAPVATATIAIIDGPNALKVVTTGANGLYQFAGLQPGGFRIVVGAADYELITRSVTLIADTVLNFDLVRPPRAVLENIEDTVRSMVQPDGSYALAPADSCVPLNA